MLQKIIDFFDFLISTLNQIFQFIINLFDGLGYFLSVIAKTIAFCFQMIGSLPPWLTVFASSTVAIMIIYIVINRKTGA